MRRKVCTTTLLRINQNLAWTISLRRTFTCSVRQQNESKWRTQHVEGSQAPSISKPDHVQQTVFSGIQPTGVPHLGNYLGALRQWKDFQDSNAARFDPKKHNLFFSIVDLHALTSPLPAPERARLRKESFISLLAIGLSPHQSTLFFQSHVPQHAELMWILSTIASTGYLSRMTQWKSKLNLPDSTTLSSDEATQQLKLGLFSYPVLQAADVLLYKATLVPVGEDQAQHIEFARTLARSFNSHYGPLPSSPFPLSHSPTEPKAENFIFTPLPSPLISPAKRIMSLRDPSQKMSKSHPDPRSRILITDPPTQVHDKLRGAVTDSIEGITYSPLQRPGISNLIEILKHVTRSERSCEDIAEVYAGLSKREFKEVVGNAIVEELKGVRERFEELNVPGNGEVRRAVEQGRGGALERAGRTMAEVRAVLGLDGGWDGEGIDL